MRTGTWILGIAVVMGGWYALRDEGSPRPAEAPQLAVAGRGFALHDPAAQRAALLDHDGQTRREVSLAGMVAETRVVGAGGSLAVVWRERGQIHTGWFKESGERVKAQTFGKRATRLCDGVASNAERFSVGWLESDNEMWFVFGPTAKKTRDHLAVDDQVTRVAAGPRTTWCTLAVSGNKTVLLWRRHGTLHIAACGKQCPGLPPQVSGPVAKRPVLGFGCAGNGCALGTRDGGALHLTWVGTNGKVKWDRVLPRHGGAGVEIIGAGDRQVAIAYVDSDGHPVVARATTTGEVTPLWRGEKGTGPTLAWVDGVLAVAYQQGGRVTTATIPLPR